MTKTIIDVVDLAKNFKDFVSSTNVKCDMDIKKTIFAADDDDFLKVKKAIGSATTILAVDKVDDAFIQKAILGE